MKSLLGMCSNTWGAERKHLKVSTKKEGVSGRSVTGFIISMCCAVRGEQNHAPSTALLYNSQPGWPGQQHALVHMTDSRPHTYCCWHGLCLRSSSCSCRLQVWVFHRVSACHHDRHSGKFRYMVYYSWQVGHRCAATSAQEILTWLFLSCVFAKKVFCKCPVLCN